MLKKWFKRRRKSSSKTSPPHGFHTVLSDVSDNAGPEDNSAKSKVKTGKGKPKNAGRKTENRKIEKSNKKDSSPVPAPPAPPPPPPPPRVQQLLPGGQVREIESFSRAISPNKRPILKFKTKGPLEQRVDLPPVRIKPIKEPRPSPPRKAALNKKVQSGQNGTAPGHELQPATDGSLDTSSLVGGPPSIDTALFAPYEGQGIEYQAETTLADAEGGPPPIIETTRVIKKNENAAALSANEGEVEVPKMSPDVLTTNFSESASAKADQANALLLAEERCASVGSNAFFIASNSNSGTGTEQLRKWIDEINRAIKESKRNEESSQEENYDRYYIETDSNKSEEHTQKNVPKKALYEADYVGTEVDPRKDGPIDIKKTLDASKAAIDKSLEETAAKGSRFSRIASGAKGILRTRNARQGVDGKGTKPRDPPTGSEMKSPLSSTPEASPERIPTKFFSTSQRQRYERRDVQEGDEEVEIETSDDAASSGSSSSAGTASETPPRIDPDPASNDEATQKSDVSFQGFIYDRICEITDKLGYGDDDAASITDDTLTSRSTISGDSYLTKGCMCFDTL